MLICWLCDKTRRIFVGERRKKEKKTGVEEEIPGLQEGVGGEGGVDNGGGPTPSGCHTPPLHLTCSRTMCFSSAALEQRL